MKKKLLFAAYVLFAVTAVFAQNEADFDVLLSPAENRVTITGYSGNTAWVQIPATIEGLLVTEIRDEAFKHNGIITSVFIPEGVVSIGNMAFAECTSLATIDIPESVTQIGVKAFYGTGLTSVRIPGSVKNLGENAFQNCTSLASVELNEGLTMIGDWTFYGCTTLRVIALPDTVEEIGMGAFASCTSLRSVIASAQSRLGNPPETTRREFRQQQGNASQKMQYNGLVAYHAILPIGSRARVTNPANNEEIEVIITGRIPASPDIIIDLSPDATNALNIDFGGTVIISFAGRLFTRRIGDNAFQGTPLNWASQALLRNFGYNHR
jgi:hypothetical protein